MDFFFLMLFSRKPIDIKCWDLGGMDQLKPLWENYYSACDGLIFVFDAAETPNYLAAACQTLCKIMSLKPLSTSTTYYFLVSALQHQDINLRKVPLLLIGTKKDLLLRENRCNFDTLGALFLPQQPVFTSALHMSF
jgi:GTPase SAR1 family protein